MKSIFKSKTFWANLLSLIAVVVQAATGKELLPMEAQASALLVINIILRGYTNKGVYLK